MIPAIETSRLSLVPMGPLVLEAMLADDRQLAERLLKCRIPPNLALKEMPLLKRLRQIQQDPATEPWLLRAIVERDSGTMIGRIGFHAPPGAEDLAETAPDGVELGYGVHEPFRRQGFAREALLAMMRWAYLGHGQRCFVLSISPQNVASTGLAKSLGYAPCGSHWDDEDGLEIVHARRFESWPDEWPA